MSPGTTLSMVFRSVQGHNGESPRSGTTMVRTSRLSCKVFDHFRRTVAPVSEKKISPLHNCLVISNAATVWGSKFDIQRKLKNANEYKALKTRGFWKWSHAVKMDLSISSVIMVGILGVNGLFNLIAFMNNFLPPGKPGNL